MESGLSYSSVLDAVIAGLKKTGVGDDGIEITADTALWAFDETAVSLNLDSLDLLEVVLELEDSLGLMLDEGDASSFLTVGDLAEAFAKSESADQSSSGGRT